MRYLILKPTAPLDPRGLKLGSTVDLHRFLPLVAECGSEREAVEVVRRSHPNAIALIFPIPIGSGQTVLLGFVNDDDQRRAIDPERPILFELFVQPIPGDDGERMFLKRRPGDAFDRKLWKVKPVMPDLPNFKSIELRATDLEVPYFGNAAIGHVDGRLTIYLQVGDVEMSLHFDDPDLAIEKRKPRPVSTDHAPGTKVPEGCTPIPLFKTSE